MFDEVVVPMLRAVDPAPKVSATQLGFGTHVYYKSEPELPGPAREWRERFPGRETTFAVETPPARETLTERRTLKGGGVAGVATIGAAGCEIARDVIAEAQAAVQPLVPYLDALRWVFIAAALAGTAVTIYARLHDWRRGRR